nr:MAG TPA: hypothetical protein [Caudoviricetes sp.]
MIQVYHTYIGNTSTICCKFFSRCNVQKTHYYM